MGRPSLYLRLEELPLEDCNQFWGAYSQRISAYEKLKILSVTGGVPRYLELIDPNVSAEENIKQLCFLKHSPLLNEFDRIFSDIFGKRSEIYKKIIAFLVKGSSNQEDILQYFAKTKTGNLSEYLADLTTAGFISRDYTWRLKTGEISKLSHYRLKDNYVRFYLKYIEPNQAKIEKEIFNNRSLGSLPGWDTMIALQFENLVLNNQNHIIKLIGVPFEELVFANPYFQRSTQLQPGCQIDFLVQTKFNNVYVCEIKFTRSAIGMEIIHEVQQKIDRLKLPKHFSYRPVLIHVNGVAEEVIDSGFFANIIDFGQLLNSK